MVLKRPILSISLSVLVALFLGIEKTIVLKFDKRLSVDVIESEYHQKKFFRSEVEKVLKNAKNVRQMLQEEVSLSSQGLTNPSFVPYLRVYDTGNNSDYLFIEVSYPMVWLENDEIRFFTTEHLLLNSMKTIFDFVNRLVNNTRQMGKNKISFDHKINYSFNWIKLFWVCSILFAFFSVYFSSKILYSHYTGQDT